MSNINTSLNTWHKWVYLSHRAYFWASEFQTIHPMQDAERELKKQIECHFRCDKRYIKLISRLIISLLKLSESNLSKWSKALSGSMLLSSKYRCLQRFLSVFRFSSQLYFEVVWGIYGGDAEVFLSLDRTEWKMRGCWVQVLIRTADAVKYLAWWCEYSSFVAV